jgi:hypothetical protein
LRDKIADRVIEIKRHSEDDCGNHDADQPIKNSAALHK